jgi:hypothetical protein
MRFLLYVPITFLMICFFSGALSAQEKPSKEYREKLNAALSEMDLSQKQTLAAYAIQRADVDAEKYLKKLIKKMKPEDRERLMELARAGANFDPEIKAQLPQKEEIRQDVTTTVEVDERVHDFGKIKEGERVSHTFILTNTGEEPLIISLARGSCGCTTPKWPRTPVPPGEQAEIEVVFNTAGRVGKQTKNVTIYANTLPDKTYLTIMADVEKE